MHITIAKKMKRRTRWEKKENVLTLRDHMKKKKIIEQRPKTHIVPAIRVLM